MKDTPQPAPPDALDNDQIIREFVAWHTAANLSLTRAADAIGYSVATASQVIDGTYKGNVNKVVAAMARRLARVQAEGRAARRPPYVKTSIAAKIIGLCEDCAAAHVVGLVIGASGVGKTEAAQAYADQAGSGAILITAAQGMSGRDVVLACANRYGLPWEGSLAHMTELAAGYLARGGQPLIIIDEADFLGHALHSARQLADRSGCGLVFLGTEAFLPMLRKHTKGTTGQVAGRIAYSLILDRILREDAEAIAAPFALSAAALRLAWSQCSGSARRLVHGLLAAARIAGSPRPEDRHIEAGFATLIPVEL